MRREKRVQEAREKEAKAQEERRRKVRKEERGSEEREVEPQGGQEGEERVDAQGGRGREEGEMKDENSLHEESHVSDRHMKWWRNAWWIRTHSGPHLRTAARPSKSVASSHRSRAGSKRDKKGLRGRKGEMGDGKQRKQRKRHAPGLPLSRCKYPSSSSSDGALAMILFVRAASVTRRGWSLAGGPSSPRTLCSW